MVLNDRLLRGEKGGCLARQREDPYQSIPGVGALPHKEGYTVLHQRRGLPLLHAGPFRTQRGLDLHLSCATAHSLLVAVAAFP